MIKIANLLSAVAEKLGFSSPTQQPDVDQTCSADRLIIHIRRHQPGVTRNDAHRVGTLVIVRNGEDMYTVSASMCSRVDRFDSVSGIRKADDPTVNRHAVTLTEDALKNAKLQTLLMDVDLASPANWYSNINWALEQPRFHRTVASWLKRAADKGTSAQVSGKEQHAAN